jgi:soluble lytic murein transglycosylase-like protein
MTKLPPVILLLMLVSVSALAQGPSLDNFDLQNGVRIHQAPPKAPTPPSKPSPAARSRGNKRSDAVSASTVLSSALVQPTLMSNSPAADVSSLRGYTTGDSQVDGYLINSGTRNGIDPLLLYSVMHQESSFKSHAVSPKGARGLMQLMPGTAIRFGVTNIFDPRQNIEGGARYLRFLTDRFNGELSLVLAGYNETQEYVRRISRRYSVIQDPSSALYARALDSRQVAGLQAKESSPLSLYERTVSTVRLPDGRLQLMSQ